MNIYGTYAGSGLELSVWLSHVFDLARRRVMRVIFQDPTVKLCSGRLGTGQIDAVEAARNQLVQYLLKRFRIKDDDLRVILICNF
jgi:hypothetical protein